MSFRGKYKLSKRNGLYNEIDTIEGANGPEIKINGNHTLTYLQIII